METQWTPEKVKKLRLRLGWSLSELARRLGCPKDILSSYEQGGIELDLEYIQKVDLLSHELERSAEQMSKRPLADIVLAEKGLNQVTSNDLKKD